ncbi:Transcriptional repressor [Granulibacter bethesdensis]|uniref:Transcriptional repressor n=2 Tax=Granulibacter bethesdensis TaxID=364410 RepID=A0AAN0RCB8_9PROT|nr:Transcriptional repressor [Granulibacter bethesdensis]AHJ64806.1 Transcriptional repressor [Granulibacter bethesdensis CGDNIH4]
MNHLADGTSSTMRAVGIKDVAEAAGVSPATVSRVLAGGKVSAALKAQVEDAIARSGYRPNLSARRLRSRNTQTIGLIVADIRNPFFTAVSRSVEQIAFASGMRVILCNTDEDPEREAMYLQLMEEERATGLILAPTLPAISRLAIHRPSLPVVLIDREGPAGCLDSVVLDNREASRTLTRHLLQNGYRRIGGLFGMASTTAVERREGYEQAMREGGLAFESRQSPATIPDSEQTAHAWLSSPHPPEALLVSNSLTLMGVTRAARSLGLSIPQQLGLAGFDNDHWTELVGPGMTVMAQPVEEIGRMAMDMLFSRLRDPDQPVRKIVLSGRQITRGSSVRTAA